MEIYKNLDSPQNKTFQDLLNLEKEKKKSRGRLYNRG